MLKLDANKAKSGSISVWPTSLHAALAGTFSLTVLSLPMLVASWPGIRRTWISISNGGGLGQLYAPIERLLFIGISGLVITALWINAAMSWFWKKNEAKSEEAEIDENAWPPRPFDRSD